MLRTKQFVLGLSLAALVFGAGLFAEGHASAAQPAAPGGPSAKPAFTVDGQVALHSFMALADAHLQKLADVLQVLATTDEVRSGDWGRIRAPLTGVAPMLVPAVLWFAQPNGTYWTVQQEGVAGNLADRPYFSRLLAGDTVLGDLVVSRSTNRNTAIVAVPVRRADRSIAGMLGASVHLDSLGAIVRTEMGGMGGGLLFFAVDSTPMGAIHSDPAMIFTEPMKLGDEGMRKAFTEMLSRPEGTVAYTFRGSPRTMLYRKSPVTGWWYAVGVAKASPTAE